MTTDWSQLTSEQLMDAWTPTIFLPPSPSRLRREVLAQNAAIEAELARRGIHPECDRRCVRVSDAKSVLPPIPWKFPIPEGLQVLDSLEVVQYLYTPPEDGPCLVYDWTYDDLYGLPVADGASQE